MLDGGWGKERDRKRCFFLNGGCVKIFQWGGLSRWPECGRRTPGRVPSAARSTGRRTRCARTWRTSTPCAPATGACCVARWPSPGTRCTRTCRASTGASAPRTCPCSRCRPTSTRNWRPTCSSKPASRYVRGDVRRGDVPTIFGVGANRFDSKWNEWKRNRHHQIRWKNYTPMFAKFQRILFS